MHGVLRAVGARTRRENAATERATVEDDDDRRCQQDDRKKEAARRNTAISWRRSRRRAGEFSGKRPQTDGRPMPMPLHIAVPKASARVRGADARHSRPGLRQPIYAIAAAMAYKMPRDDCRAEAAR